MEAGVAPCYIVRDSHENKQRGGETLSKRGRERMAEWSITAIHPQSLNFYFLCLCDQPFDFRQKGRRGQQGEVKELAYLYR